MSDSPISVSEHDLNQLNDIRCDTLSDKFYYENDPNTLLQHTTAKIIIGKHVS